MKLGKRHQRYLSLGIALLLGALVAAPNIKVQGEQINTQLCIYFSGADPDPNIETTTYGINEMLDANGQPYPQMAEIFKKYIFASVFSPHYDHVSQYPQRYFVDQFFWHADQGTIGRYSEHPSNFPYNDTLKGHMSLELGSSYRSGVPISYGISLQLGGVVHNDMLGSEAPIDAIKKVMFAGSEVDLKQASPATKIHFIANPHKTTARKELAQIPFLNQYIDFKQETNKPSTYDLSSLVDRKIPGYTISKTHHVDATKIDSAGKTVTDNEPLTGSNRDQGDIYYYYDANPAAAITVNYQVDDQAHTLLDTETISPAGKFYGDPYTTTSKQFTGYELAGHPTNASGTFSDQAGLTVTYHYQKKALPHPSELGNVQVQYLDPDGQDLQAPAQLQGIIGTTYQTKAPSFAGYTLTANPSNAAGTFRSGTVVIIYRYQRIHETTTWQVNPMNAIGTVVYHPNYGIAVWDDFQDTRHLVYGRKQVKRLPHRSRWRIFEKAIRADETWYNLGGEQWVQAKYLKLEAPTNDNYRITQLKGVATINYQPGYGIALWNHYGAHRQLATWNKLPHQSRWRVFAQASNGAETWYNLGGQQWISSQYARVQLD
ncbi:MucBP domain-containing protein [Lapidilactobacillus achengensis]|uniref:MucBP domain-containing protein n=1 Tax=Lapidilactobacillus achengensis TaxID=2486000 RepID=A0ABW1UTC0_9LACO|nr:MucBP domain-containing protein [Lapidilactobacillus achengensis]